MRAHQALKELEKVGMPAENPPDGVARLYQEITLAKSLLPHAVSFDLGSISVPQEHTEFGLDMLTKGMLRLPFQTVFFSCADGHFLAGMLMQKPNEQTLAELSAILKDHGTELPQGTMEFLSTEGAGALTVVQLASDGEMLVPVSSVMVPSGAGSDGNLRLKFWTLADSVPSGSDLTQEERLSAAGFPVGRVCGIVALLMSRDVETKHIKAPDVLNKARARKGKPRIGDTYEVRLKLSPSSSGPGHSSGNGRASPRMHWRRGHYRRLRERLIPIPPCLVSAGDGADALMPKDYVMPSSPIRWGKLQ